MKNFTYTITDPDGIHARPAGILVKKASLYSSDITISFAEKTADAKRIFAIMGLGIKNGDTISISVSGADEDIATSELLEFFKENL